MTEGEVLKQLEDSTKNASHHQIETLQSILQHNGGVSYLRPFLRGSAAPIDAQIFRRCVPLSTYDAFADHINRIADGVPDHNPPLSVDPLLCFFYSSGASTMKPKLIPYFDSPLSRAASHMAHQGSAAILRRLFPPRQSAGKILWFIYADNVTTTKGGYQVMAASTYPLQRGSSAADFSRTMPFCSPKEVIFGSNYEQQLYCHLLCGLRNYDSIDCVRAPYAVGLIRAFSLLESNWEQLCKDLEQGFPYPEIVNVTMRNSVNKVLGGPQVDLAKRIRSICQENSWEGIIPKLWPNVRYVKCVTTGSMKQYYSKLKHYAAEIPVLGGDYFASECCVGINMDIMQPPELTRYIILPTAAYFEFLPYDPNGSEFGTEETVDISGVEVGRMYEVVVTTYRGLYRYCLGDIVKVVGFYNSCPELEFVMRAPKTSKEIFSERDIMLAVEGFRHKLKNAIAAEVKEFSSYIDLDLSPKQLKFFIEIEECVLLQEEKLQELESNVKKSGSSIEDGLGGIYKVLRNENEVGPLIISIVKPGSFNQLSHIAIQNGAPASQYKPPKIIRNREAVDLMQSSSLVTVCLGSS